MQSGVAVTPTWLWLAGSLQAEAKRQSELKAQQQQLEARRQRDLAEAEAKRQRDVAEATRQAELKHAPPPCSVCMDNPKNCV